MGGVLLPEVSLLSWTNRRSTTSASPHACLPERPAPRCLSDCGLRLGELLGIERSDLDGDTLRIRGNAHNGVYTPGDQPTKRHVRTVPVPPSLLALLRALPARIDTPLLFPTPTGKLWWERNFYRDVWAPAVRSSGLVCTPHDLRHSWVTHLRAAGIDPADLAAIAGHTVETATARYTHPLRRSDEAVRALVG
jgi:integrase